MNQTATLHPATVERITPVSDDLFELTLQMGPEVTKSYLNAGQFHPLRANDFQARPFAIASAPGSDRFEYLIRRGSPLANALSVEGATVSAGLVEGKGFPLEASAGRDLLLVATGTGLAPIRSVIEVLKTRRADFGQVTLLLGGRRPTDFGWHREWPSWTKLGIEVVPTVLHPEPGWTGQHAHLVTLLPDRALEKTTVFIVGGDELVAEVRTALHKRGVDSRHVHLNV